MNYNNIFFDLDGTLTDPAEGITNSVAYALRKLGIDEPDRKKLDLFIGPPLIDSFMRYYGFTHELSVKAVEYYREYFGPKGIYENAVFEGIPEMLEELKKEGKKLYLATAKPEPYALEIVKHFDLLKYLDGLYGSTMTEERTRKDEVIAYALEKTKLNKNDVIMVGDRMHDIKGASENGLKSIGVLFGYGSLAELTDAGADYIVKTVTDLKNILIGGN